jgi:hypothetical protein
MSPVPARGSETAGGRWEGQTEKKTGGDVASTTQTATYTSPQFAIEDAISIDAQLNVTAISGTGASARLKLQMSQDGTTWVDAPPGDNYPNVTTVSSQNQSWGTPGNYGRWVVTIAGTTPSVTFSIDHQARVSRM